MTIALSIIIFLVGVGVGIAMCGLLHFSRENCDEGQT